MSPEHKKAMALGRKKFHENPDKPTSAGVPRPNRTAMSSVTRKLSNLSGPSIDLISKAILGDLVPEKTIWKGKEEDKIKALEKDPSLRFDFITLDDGTEVEVMVEWVKVSESKLAIAKWIIQQEVALKKAAEESKLRKITTAVQHKKAVDEGAMEGEDKQEKAREFGGPKRLDMSGFEDEDE